jgi:hypothetical protein
VERDVAPGDNGYSVAVEEDAHGWRVDIVDETGAVVGGRACRDHIEARTYASTVRQHIDWLSPQKFREYYRV